MGVIGSASKALVQGFANPKDAKDARDGSVDLLVVLLAFFLSIALLSLVGKLLWNNVIVDLMSFARPARSIWQILGLYVFIALILP